MLLADYGFSPPRALSYFTGGSLGSAKLYLSMDGSATAEWARFEIRDWSTRQRKVKGEAYSLLGTPYTSISPQGSKGRMTLYCEDSCPKALYDPLRALSTVRTHHTLHVEHSGLGTKDLDVEVMSVQTPEDAQFQATDPVGAVTVSVMSFGAAA